MVIKNVIQQAHDIIVVTFSRNDVLCVRYDELAWVMSLLC